MRAFETAVRVAGACVSVVLGALTALYEAFLTPRFWVIPVAAALVANLLLYLFAQYTVAKAWAWILPAVPWFLVMFFAVGGSGEGDLIANAWTGLATFAAGAAGFFVPAALRKPLKAPGFVDGQGEEVDGMRPGGG